MALVHISRVIDCGNHAKMLLANKIRYHISLQFPSLESLAPYLEGLGKGVYVMATVTSQEWIQGGGGELFSFHVFSFHGLFWSKKIICSPPPPSSLKKHPF